MLIDDIMKKVLFSQHTFVLLSSQRIFKSKLSCTREESRQRETYVDRWVLGILPPETFYSGIFPQGMFPSGKNRMFFWFLAALFRFVARSLALGLRTLVSTGSRQRHISQSQASLGWNFPGGNSWGGTFRGEFSGGEFAGHHNFPVITQENCRKCCRICTIIAYR